MTFPRTKVLVSKEIFACIAPMMYISRIMGLSPFLFKKLNNDYQLIMSRKLIAYSYAMITLVVCLSIYGLNCQYKIDIIQRIRIRTLTGKFVTYLEDCYLLSTCIFGVLYVSLKYKTFLEYTFMICQVKVQQRVDQLGEEKLPKMYIFTVVFFTVVSSLVGLREYYQIKEVYNARMSEYTDRTVTCVDILVVLFPIFFGVIVTPFKVVSFNNNMTQICKVDKLIEIKSNQKKKCLALIIVSISLTFFILSVDLSLWTNIAKKSTSVLTIMRNLIPFYCAYCFTLIIELNYWHFVHLVEIRLKALNDQLEAIRMNTFRVNPSDNLDFLLMNQNAGRALESVTLRRMNKEIKGSASGVSRKGLTNLMKVYELIYDASVAVNDFYGLMILFVLIGCLIHLLVTPYCLYLQIKNTNQSFFIASQLFWMLCHVLRLILIVEPCHNCQLQVRKTGSLVCKLLLLWQNHEEVKMQLEMFATLLSMCKIQFTASGLTNIDRHLLTTITGAVTTYLVILFQFNNV